MTDREKERPDEERVARWVGELPPVDADPAFRNRLRSAFASGRLAPTRTPASAHLGRALRPQWWRSLIPTGVAVAVLLAVVAINRGLELHLVASAGTGEVSIDGQAIALTDTDALNAAIRPGAEIVVPAGATMDLAVDGVVMYELVGARMTLPHSPGRWFHRTATSRLFSGEIRLKTGRDFEGSQLAIYTPEGKVEVTGTLLSVQCDEGGTCVCVLEGVAHVGVNEADMEPVEPGFRKIMLRDGTVDIIPVKPMHRDGVLDFDRRIGSTMDE